jgi:hypothetical protein
MSIGPMLFPRSIFTLWISPISWRVEGLLFTLFLVLSLNLAFARHLYGLNSLQNWAFAAIYWRFLKFF